MTKITAGIRNSIEEHIGCVVLCRPPHNFLDLDLLTEVAEAVEELDADDQCRVVVLAADGKSFCAGANFNLGSSSEKRNTGDFYAQAMRLFRTTKPIIAAVQGAAIGAGLGLALAADFRVTCKEARFSANFARLGLHPGFGLSYTLPALIGSQKAGELLYTGRRIDGDYAVKIGLADLLVDQENVLINAIQLATEIATSAPKVVQGIRATLRAGFADLVVDANRHELEIQKTQFITKDFKEGVAAMAARRLPIFIGN